MPLSHSSSPSVVPSPHSAPEDIQVPDTVPLVSHVKPVPHTVPLIPFSPPEVQHSAVGPQISPSPTVVFVQVAVTPPQLLSLPPPHAVSHSSDTL